MDLHQDRTIRAEDQTAAEILRVMERSRQRVAARLLDASTAGQRHLKALLREIEHAIVEMSGEVQQAAQQSFGAAFARGAASMAAELGIFELADSLIVPAVPTRVVELLHGRSLDYLDGLTAQVRRDVLTEIEMGVIEGRDFADIIRRVVAPEGSLWTMPYATAVRTVRQTIGESYNQARHETIVRTAKQVPGLGKAWLSKLVDSTTICLELHGQKVGPDEDFVFRGGAWRGKQPWAVWQGAIPKYHICHSVIVPHSDRWPPNPKLDPLTPEQIAARQAQVAPGRTGTGGRSTRPVARQAGLADTGRRMTHAEISDPLQPQFTSMDRPSTKAVMEAVDRAGMRVFLEKHPALIELRSEVFVGERSANGSWKPSGTPLIQVRSNRRDFGPLREKGDIQSISALGETLEGAMQRTLAHELGHHLALCESEHKQTIQQLVDQAFDKGNHLTVRAKKNPDEYFAECHAAYVFHRGRLRKDDPIGYSMVEQVRRLQGVHDENQTQA